MFLPSKEMMVMANPTSLFTAYASIAGSVMLFRSIANELVPRPIRSYLLSALDHLIFKRKTPDLLTLIVEDSSSRSMGANQVYEAAEMYLCTKISPTTTGRLKICKTYKEKNLTIKLVGGEHFVEQFEGIEVAWAFVCPREDKNQDPNGHPQFRNSFFELSFQKEHKDQVLDIYLPFVLEKAKSIKDKERVLKMYTLTPDVYVHGSMWESVNLEHPSTFHTLAMEAELKKTVMEDLDMFLRRKEFYKRVGRAWKRGYLLYGPPGTGKSSLVAAMANYLKFDVYDLQLGNVKRDSDLRRLLLATGNRSILVIEDIDCSVDLPDRVLNPAAGKSKKSGDGPNQGDKQLTLSGLLNFIDGLWSSCGDERIIVFTTNHKDRLDPALLRPGRMDMHIHMSYCSSDGFRLLASNYLGMSSSSSSSTGGHAFEEIEHLMDSRETEVTPAQVAEEMMKSENPDIALEGLVKLLRRKRKKSKGNEIAIYDGNKNGAAPKSKRPIAEADESPTKSPRSSGRKKITKRCC